MPRVVGYPDGVTRTTREATRGIDSWNYFAENAIWETGLSRSGFDSIKPQLDNRKRFEVERFSADGNDVRVFHILFANTADAKRFVDEVQASFNSLPIAQQDQVDNNAFMARSANHVAIGLSGHVKRREAIWEQYNDIPENSPNLISGGQ